MPRKSLPEDQKTKVFGLSVPARLLEAYRNLGNDKRKAIRNATAQVFQTQMLIAIGGQMIASDDRREHKT